MKVEVVNPDPEGVMCRLVRLGVPSDAMSSISGADCIAPWSASRVSLVSTPSSSLGSRVPRFNGEILPFSAGPRADRFIDFDPPTEPASPLTLHVVPQGQQCAKPVMYDDLRDAIGEASQCLVETDGDLLPVIDHWVSEGNLGMPMTQLHLVTSR